MAEQQSIPDRDQLLWEAEELKQRAEDVLERILRTPLGPEFDALQNEAGNLLNAEQDRREQAAALAQGNGAGRAGQSSDT